MTGALVTRIPVLDHGFVELRNLAGPTRRAYNIVSSMIEPDTEREFDADDIDPAQAARMSFDQMDSNRTAEEDYKLCRYLMKNWHTSPFEMVQVWLEMKLPIFVARQFVRHRTVRLNEMSARYVTLPAEWYIPDVVGGKAKSAKQGQEDNLSAGTQQWFKDVLNDNCKTSYADYLEALECGVAAEHARMLLHLNHYTHWLWNQDLHNLMHFMSLRTHSHAQKEAQILANAVYELIKMRLPKSMELFDEFRRRA